MFSDSVFCRFAGTALALLLAGWGEGRSIGRCEPRTPITLERRTNLPHPGNAECIRAGETNFLSESLDLKAVLEDSIGKDFELVDAKLGSASGKLWWFKDKTFAAH